MTVFDFDDHHPGNDAMPWMHRLKEINPAFKATLFTIPALSPDDWVDAHPDWVELVPHGWEHGDPPSDGGECKDWTFDDTRALILDIEDDMSPRWTRGFKAPGWQISDECYSTLGEYHWWVADQHLEDNRRPATLLTYFYEDDGNWHGHVQNVCGNGIEETWAALVEKVRATNDFRFASEAVKVPVA